ncbi:hypothetical protein B0A49_11446 [Cryomyces minteri]|uniref:Uncharacterized protein n=1 Tax=Cryomyces minteri TaxID=331657 RepID=A0A4U0VJS8_9PEZI|nr:hypothetical protein B0A49_11446 [Cryomyces minteri]
MMQQTRAYFIDRLAAMDANVQAVKLEFEAELKKVGCHYIDSPEEISNRRYQTSNDDAALDNLLLLDSINDGYNANASELRRDNSLEMEHEAKVAMHIEACAPRRHHDDDDETAPGILRFMTEGQAKHPVEQQKKKGGA